MAFDPGYGAQPLGSLPSERHLAAPYNARPVDCVVKVRNLSADLKRKVVEEAVSIRRGGERSISDGPYKGKQGTGVSVDALRWRVAQGENMNWEVERISPVDMVITHGGRKWLIPHTDKQTGEAAPWVTVDPGAWDLYMGNWERMHSDDNQEKQKEAQRLSGRGLSRFVASPDNQYGFLEFKREEIKTQDVAVDNLALKSGNLIEV